jgi:hypothetical protein
VKITEAERQALFRATREALENALPDGTPARVDAGRAIDDVLVDGLPGDKLKAALDGIGGGAGGELKPTARGNVPMCSAESSALMAVNFLAPLEHVEFERELRVIGVRAQVGPTLDAVLDGSVAVETKVAEPWRSRPKVEISVQYDAPAAGLGIGDAVVALRRTRPYAALDAAQLVKHLLGVHSAVEQKVLSPSAKLVLLYWRPSRPGTFGALFDLLAEELADFAARFATDDIAIEGWPTCELLDQWEGSATLAEHAVRLRVRYDPPLSR